jgi:hypothetical protein
VKVRIQPKSSWPATGSLMLDVAATAEKPVVVPFVIKRSLAARVVLKPVWGALVLTFFLLVLFWIYLRSRGVQPLHPLLVEADWKFNESWASNLAAAGALVAAVVAGIGQVTELLPQFPVAQLVAVNIFFGFVALLAPMAFQIFRVDGKGTVLGLLAGATFTAWAAFGQIASLSLLAGRSGLPQSLRWGLQGLTVTVFMLIAAYVARSVTAMSVTAGEATTMDEVKEKSARSTALM